MIYLLSRQTGFCFRGVGLLMIKYMIAGVTESKYSSYRGMLGEGINLSGNLRLSLLIR